MLRLRDRQRLAVQLLRFIPYQQPARCFMKCITTLVLFIVFALTGTSYAAVLRLGVTDSPPFSTPDGSGLADRIVKEALKREGIEVKTVILPSERSLINANEGVVDGDYIRIEGIQNTYKNLIMVPESVCDYEFTAFTKKPGVKLTSWADLSRYHVAFITGWKLFENNVNSAKSLTKVKNADALFELLANDRADIVLIERKQGEMLVRKHRIERARAVNPPLAVRKMYLYLHSKHSALVPGIARQLLGLKQGGFVGRMLEDVRLDLR